MNQKSLVKLSPREHDAYKWLPLEEARERMIFSEQKRAIAHVDENFVKRKPHHVNEIEIPEDRSLYL